MMITDQFNRPLRDLRISITDRCNFRCTYCMPEEIFNERYRFMAREELLTFEEITRLARLLVSMGVQKLRLTGGEPLMRKEVEKLVGMLAAIDNVDDFAMTTNAYFLPNQAESLKQAGLQRLTVSLDTLDEAIFQQMNGKRARVAQVLAGIQAAEEAGFAPIKINAVIQRGVNDHTLVDLARFGKEHGYIVRFIEYMDVGNINGWRMDDVVPAKEMVAQINAELPIEPLDSNYHGEVAKRYRFIDGGGELGFITSVTQPFCGGCSRLRLSPEGELFTCLFGSKGTNLRDPMRSGASDEDLLALLSGLWHKRADRYSEIRTHQTHPREKVEMYHIGG